MKIETKFNIGDKVQYFRDGSGMVTGTIITIETWHKSDESSITYVIETVQGLTFRLHEESLKQI